MRKWIKELYIRTKSVARIYTGIFIVVMFLNQLLFFGLCLNPICIVAAMPHVLAITVIIGMFLHKPSKKNVQKSLKFVKESYEDVKKHIEDSRKKEIDGLPQTDKSDNLEKKENLFSGNIHIVTTQNKSKGEEDFQTILYRDKKAKIASIIRMNNQYREKALLHLLKNSLENFKAGDIVAIVRGGGDTKTTQFNVFRDLETCEFVDLLSKNHGVITVSGIAHSSDNFLIEKYVTFAQTTPTDAAMQVLFILNGNKWDFNLRK